MTSPHQLPSISHPRERHTRRPSTKLTSGTNTPIDLRASVVHNAQRAFTVDQIVDKPRTAIRAARPTFRNALSPANPSLWSDRTSAAAGKVDIQIQFRRRTRRVPGGRPMECLFTWMNYGGP